MKYIRLGEQPDSSVHRANNRLLSKRSFRPWKAFLSWFELHWTFISRENTWNIFAWANNQIPVFPGGNNRFPSKSFLRPWKAILSWFELHWTYISWENTWSIFAWADNQIPVFAGRITDYSQKGSFGLEKRFYLGLSFIGRIFLEKKNQVYSPGRKTRFQCSPPGRITDSHQNASLGLEKRF